MNVCAIIPARGGSKRVANKNLRRVGGLTLVGRAVRCARDAGIDDVYVTTDDWVIAKHALECDALAIDRPARLATDTATLEPVLEHALGVIGWEESDACVVLQPTSPLRRIEHVHAAIALLESGYDSALAVTEELDCTRWGGDLKAAPHRLHGPDGSMLTVGRWHPYVSEDGNRPRTQDLPRRWVDCGLIYAVRVPWFREHRVRYGRDKVGAVVVDRWAALDVDSEDDLLLADYWAMGRRR